MSALDLREEDYHGLRSFKTWTDPGLARLTAIAGVALAFWMPIFPVPWRVYRVVGRWVGSDVVGWGLVQLTLELIVVVLMPILFSFVQGQKVRRLVRAKEGRLFGDLALGVGTFVLVAVANLVKRSPDVLPRPTPRAGYILASPVVTPFALPLPMRIAISLTNGISEELGCRAYAILTLESVGVPAVWTALFCWVCSVGIHVPAWGLRRQVILGQLIFVLLYEYRRSLIASGLTHILADGFALVVWERLPAIIQRIL